MRTQGTFTEIYEAAKNHYKENRESCPIDPVIRRVDGLWVIESGLESEENADIECSLDTFDDWFYEWYSGESFCPGFDIEEDFANNMLN